MPYTPGTDSAHLAPTGVVAVSSTQARPKIKTLQLQDIGTLRDATSGSGGTQLPSLGKQWPR